MTPRKCANCSFNELEHERVMNMAPSLFRHAFVIQSDYDDDYDDLIADSTPKGVPDPRRDSKYVKKLPSATTLSAFIKRGLDPHVIDKDAFETLKTPEGFKFRGLGQVYEGDTRVSTSPIGVLANAKLTEDDGPSPESQDFDESKGSDRWIDQRYDLWQDAVNRNIKPHAVIRSRKNGSIFEVYKTTDGQFLYVGAGGREHDDLRSAGDSKLQLGEHVIDQHRPEDAPDVIDPVTGTSIVVPQGTQVQGPDVPQFKTKGSGRRYTPEKQQMLRRKAIEDWGSSRGVSYDDYLESLATAHENLPHHSHKFDLSSQGFLYTIAQTDEGHQVLARAPESMRAEMGRSPVPARHTATVIHSILQKLGDLPTSTVQEPTEDEFADSFEPTEDDVRKAEEAALNPKKRKSVSHIEEMIIEELRNS